MQHEIVVTQTYPVAVRHAMNMLGNNLMHNPSPSNPSGVSGISTLVDDIFLIIQNSPNMEQAKRSVERFLSQGRLEVTALD